MNYLVCDVDGNILRTGECPAGDLVKQETTQDQWAFVVPKEHPPFTDATHRVAFRRAGAAIVGFDIVPKE